MIKILFISNSPTANLLQIHLMQTLKVRIDIVEDLDRGLKDVFEQHPVIVCIQDQIAGITGESVVSHIKLLLSDTAPQFILLHDGNDKTIPLPDMFSDQVSLARPFEEVYDAMLKSLRTLLGEHWDMVYQPAPEALDLPPEPKPGLNPADQLVEDFIAEHSLPTADNATSNKTSEAANHLFEHDIPGGPPAEFHEARPSQFVPEPLEKSEKIPAPEKEPVKKVMPVLPPADMKQGNITEPKHDNKPRPKPSPNPNPKPDQRPNTVSLAKNTTQSRTLLKPPVKPDISEPPPISNKKPTGEPSVTVEDILQESENSYRKYKRNIMLCSVVSVLLILAFFVYYWNGKTVNLSKIFKTLAVQQKTTDSTSKTDIQPPPDAAKQAVPKTVEVPAKTPPLPSFIPADGIDPDFTKSRPGWFRYLTRQREYRLFRPDGDITALQVIASAGKNISVSELKQNLMELTGSEQYRIVKKTLKEGIHIEHCVVEKHGELMIYRSTVDGPINAYVFARTP